MNKTEVGNDSLENQDQNEDKSVDIKAYRDVSKDMHRYKDEARQLKEELARLKADEDAKEQQKLIDEKKYKQAFEMEKARLEEYRRGVEAKEQALTRERKLVALQGMVEFEKPEYAEKFVDLDSIHITDDNKIDEYSLKAAAERFKQEHPSLLKQSTKRTGVQSSVARPNNESAFKDDLSFDEYAKLPTQERQAWIHNAIKHGSYRRPID